MNRRSAGGNRLVTAAGVFPDLLVASASKLAPEPDKSIRKTLISP
jgi:hypothetical protein